VAVNEKAILHVPAVAARWSRRARRRHRQHQLDGGGASSALESRLQRSEGRRRQHDTIAGRRTGVHGTRQRRRPGGTNAGRRGLVPSASRRSLRKMGEDWQNRSAKVGILDPDEIAVPSVPLQRCPHAASPHRVCTSTAAT
jgi:hypothetical protein